MDKFSEQKKVQEAIEIRILKGEFGENGQLPTIKQIAEKYDVGNTTVIVALKGLVEKGILSSRQGKGYFVVPFSKSVLVDKYKERLNDLLKEVHDLSDVLEMDIQIIINN